MSSSFDPQHAALTIEATRVDARTVEPFTDQVPSLDLATAYEVAARASALRRSATRARPVGRKIGFTNRTIWERYGVHEPIWGWMYDDTVVLADAAVTEVDLSRLVQPRIEPEIVFRLARAVTAGMTADELAGAVEWVAFGYEVVHCHYPGWRFRIADTVIDAGLHGASRVGARRAPWPAMAAELASFTLRLGRDGEPIDAGRGANVLGSPLHALAHLLDVLGDAGLTAGEIVTTGTITDAAPVRAGETYSVEIDGLAVPPLTLRCV